MRKINKYHLERRDKLIKAIEKASEQASIVWMYLTANDDVPPENIADVALVKEHLEIALGHLGISNLSEEEGGEIYANGHQ